jgi:hypothetical protein
LSTFAVESDRCFSLIGDAERGDVMAVSPGVGRDLSKGRNGQIGDLGAVVFDLAGARKVLGQFSIRRVNNSHGLVESYRTDP